MRSSATALVISLLIFVNPVLGLEVVEVEDILGDVDGPTSDAASYVDLVGGSALVTDTHLIFEAEVDDLSNTQHAQGFSIEYWLSFEYRDTEFDAALEYLGPNDDRVGFHRVYRASGDGWERIADGTIEVDASNNLVTGTILLSDIRSDDGLAPGPGEPIRIKQLVAYWDGDTAQYHFGSSGVAAHRDDSQFDATAILDVPGAVSDGLALTTERPIRFSNGEGSTFHWPVVIQNKQAGDAEALISVTSDEQGVALRYPEAVRVPANGETTIDVFATVPFAHQHGDRRTIQAQVEVGGESSSIDLAIHYLDVPQPAGHHDRVFLHSGTPGGAGTTSEGWMNTLELDDSAGEADLAPRTGGCLTNTTSTSGLAWWIPLRPELLIGLDAREGEEAHLEASLVSHSGLPTSGNVYAAVELYDTSKNPFRMIDLEGFVGSQAIGPMVQGDSVYLDFPVPLPPALGDLPAKEGQNMALHVVFCPEASDLFDSGTAYNAATLATSAPPLAIAAGGFIDMPLDEYRDAVDFTKDAEGALFVPSEVLRVQPGTTAFWTVELQNVANPYGLSLFGVHADQARILSGAIASADATIAVVADAPEMLRSGDVLEVVLVAENPDDPSDVVAVRLTAIIDPEGMDYSTQAAQYGVAEGNDAPAPFALLGILAALWVARRR